MFFQYDFLKKTEFRISYYSRMMKLGVEKRVKEKIILDEIGKHGKIFKNERKVK